MRRGILVALFLSLVPSVAWAQAPISFPDPSLEAGIRAAIGKPSGNIFPDDLAGLRSLDLGQGSIGDLTGIQHAVNLEELVLESNDIDDITPLETLEKLRSLNLRRNGISDLSPLQSLGQLEALLVDDNEVVDLSPLDDLISLIELGLSGNAITDLNPLAALINLVGLDLRENDLDDIAPIATLAALEWLRIDENGIEDLGALAGMPRLAELTAVNNGIFDLSPLAGLSLLTYVNLNRNGVEDLSPLSGHSLLEVLTLSDNDISDVSTMTGLTGLQMLDLDLNEVGALTGIGGLNALESLSLQNNEVEDLGPLRTLSRLHELNLSDNAVSTLAPLRNLPALRVLIARNNDIEDISGLASLSTLMVLDLSINAISDISALQGLTALEVLRLWDNEVSNLSPLQPLLLLRELDLNRNSVRSLDALSSHGQLADLSVADNDLTSIAALATMPSLEKLNLARNGIANLQPLSALRKLQSLLAHHNEIQNVQPLQGVASLHTVDLAWNDVSGISALLSLGLLESLDLSDNPLTAADLCTAIPTLESGGVEVHYDGVCLAGQAVDSDGDSLPDAAEVSVHFTNPDDPDSDGDGMPDGFEVRYTLDPGQDDAQGDDDFDGLRNLLEYFVKSNPQDPGSPGRVFFVGPQGKDLEENGLTETRPWRSISYAQGQIAPRISASMPHTLVLLPGAYREDKSIRMLPWLTMIGSDKATCIVRDRLIGARFSALRNLTLAPRPNTSGPSLRIYHAAMEVEQVVFDGPLSGTGVRVQGITGAPALLDSCRFLGLATGIIVDKGAPRIRRCTFMDISGDAILVRDTKAAKQGALVLGDANNPETGYNTFENVGGFVVSNEGDTPVTVENNYFPPGTRTNGNVEVASPLASSILAGSIICTVWDSATKQRIKNANVVLNAYPPLTASEEGVYSFACVLPGSHTIRITAAGYKEVLRQVAVGSGMTEALVFPMAAPGTPPPPPPPPSPNPDPGCFRGSTETPQSLSGFFGFALVITVLTLLRLASFRLRPSRV